LSLTVGEVPQDFKISRVSALHKGGSQTDVANYRSIFVPSTFALILEKLVCRKLLHYLENQRILVKQQFGFRQKHSTTQAALRVANDILLAADTGGKTGVVFVDVKNAFPSANHQILLNKLAHYGVSGSLHKWFTSYLHDRTMYVELQGVQSQLHGITKGVPQGSALGPVLFSLYINDIVNTVTCSATLFADDLELHVSCKNIADTAQQLNKELSKLSMYMKTNRLELNVKKTVCMFPFSHDPSITIEYNGTSLNIVSEYKYLGIWFDSYFTWNSQFQHLIKKIKQRMYIMYRSCYYCRFQWRKLLFDAFVKPYFLYGIEVWYATSIANRDKLELLHRRCLRIILNDTGMIPLLSRYNVYCETNSWPLSLQFQFRAAILMFDITHVKAVPAFLNLFSLVSSRSVSVTRLSSDTTSLESVPIRHERTRIAIRWWGPKLWNSIPQSIRTLNLQAFCIPFARKYAQYLDEQFGIDYVYHRNFHDFV
jgi:hypothetical protein